MKTVLLIGLGVEGRAAARHFLSEGYKVIAADSAAADAPCPREFSHQENFHWCTEEAAPDVLAGTNLVLRSPGIPPSHTLVTAALHQGHQVTTPTGYWLANHAPANTLTVTGSKGKSTTVTLTVDLLKASGMDAAPHGNIGLPPLDQVMASADYPVLELSSYMLHDIQDGPYTHVVTNLFREHTPWHGSESAYHEAKLRPFRFDPPRPGMTSQTIIDHHHLPDSVHAAESLIADNAFDPSILPEEFHDGPLLIALRHAVAAAHLITGNTVLESSILATAEQYQGLPSRQEKVPSTDGRFWINDALATVPEAVLHVIQRYDDKQICLLLGGADREQDFSTIALALASRKNIISLIFGSTASRLEKALRDSNATFRRCDSYEDALTVAAEITPENGVVLFSPAAASEAPHGNFSVRADIFRQRAAEA
ncbi:MAG: UDP-N-acetylmuramoyl-L-alanine--D-glutamate ligase [Pseudomonadota bacterium]